MRFVCKQLTQQNIPFITSLSRPIYENEDGSLKKQGDIIRLPLLATTLRKLAAEGAKAFYNGSLTPDIIADLKDGYGTNIIDSYDLLHYRFGLS